MKVLHQWLKEFVAFDGSPQDAADLLAKLGFEIAGVTEYGGRLNGVITAFVKEAGKHPNADRLSLCQVDTGRGLFQVVCGAPNVRVGQKVALAQVGATLPNGDVLKAAKIRGVESQGMICSASELGLEEKFDGILVLPESTPVGVDVRPLLGLDDALIELEVTPNRRDVLGVLGVARELAAGAGLPLRLPEPRVRELELGTIQLSVLNEAPAWCPRYIARLMKGVKVQDSPDWMARRLLRCGVRPINNLVDITNYVMLELGQPMHAFDAARLEGAQVRIRPAREGETLLTLDGKTAALKMGMPVIADAARPIALAGIMGGQESAISESTQDIVLESAAFHGGLVRRTSKALGIRSESSYRFERGSDLEMAAFASRRAAQLVQELAGGLGYKPIEASAPLPSPGVIKLRTDRMRQFLGADVRDAQAAELLRRLGFVIQSGTSQLSVTVPSWRLDIQQEADVIEEVARLYGYDQIPSRLPSVHSTTVQEDPHWDFEARLREWLAGSGFLEASNTTLIGALQVEGFIPGFGQPADAKPVALANPLTQDQALLRPCLLPGLLRNGVLNFQRGQEGVRLFERGRVFYQDQDGRHEARRTGILLAGTISAKEWRRAPVSADFFALKGHIEALLEHFHIERCSWTAYRHPAFHPKRSALLVAGKSVLAWIGELHPEQRDRVDRQEPMAAAELDTEAWRLAAAGVRAAQPLPQQPPVLRDLSLVGGPSVTCEKLRSVIRTAGGPWLENERLIDRYQDAKLGSGMTSYTFSLLFRHPERTLSDAEIEKVMSRIVAEVSAQTAATLRA